MFQMVGPGGQAWLAIQGDDGDDDGDDGGGSDDWQKLDLFGISR